MNKILFLVLFFSMTLFSQEHDVSFWSRNTSLSAFPWYFYGNGKIVLDTRFNFDAEKTAGVCIGKSFSKKENITLIPEACGYLGKTNGLGPELLVMTKKGKFNSFSQNQYVHGIGNTSFVYHWTDVQWQVQKRISVGADGQIFKEMSKAPTAQVDLGPSTKLILSKHVYFKFWPAWSIGPQNVGEKKIFLGLGYTW